MREIIPIKLSSRLRPLVPDTAHINRVCFPSLDECLHDLDCRGDAVRLLLESEQPPTAYLIAIRGIYAAADTLNVSVRSETASPAADARCQDIEACVRDAHAALVDLMIGLGREYGAAFAAQVRAHQDSGDAADRVDLDDRLVGNTAIGVAALREIAAPLILLASMSGSPRQIATQENCDDLLY